VVYFLKKREGEAQERESKKKKKVKERRSNVKTVPRERFSINPNEDKRF